MLDKLTQIDMATYMILFSTIVCLYYVLIDKLHLHKRISYSHDDGMLWWHYTWIPEHNYFCCGTGKKIIPDCIRIRRRDFFIPFTGSCAGRYEKAFTKRGAIRKLIKSGKDISNLNLERIR